MSGADKVVLRSGKQLTEYVNKARSKSKDSVASGQSGVATERITKSTESLHLDSDSEVKDSVFLHNVERDADTMANAKYKAIAGQQEACTKSNFQISKHLNIEHEVNKRRSETSASAAMQTFNLKDN